MTQIYKKEFKCALCGNLSTHEAIISTNTLGWPDLDTRPSEMARSTINAWIQMCPSCGFCAPDISEEVAKAAKVVQGNVYREQLENPDYPKLANSFLCWSLIQEISEQFSDAGWASVHAAWACDDRGSIKSGQLCRMRAAHLFLRAREKGQKFAKGVGTEEALILTDILRRADRFEEALTICEEALTKGADENVKKLLEHEKTLIEEQDTSVANQSTILFAKVFQKMEEKGIKKKVFTRKELNALIKESENDSK
ncbi:MAG: DUF2225 domain-containing protein [Deltaproteobacteria bacterium]|nr:DUF2225 domain-containing protein [Deltaproteobacteria bacterium]